MKSALGHMASLTRFRDREVLDLNLVTSLFELLNPRSVAIHRLVGASPQRWLQRASQAAGLAAAVPEPGWVEIESLPAREAHPVRDRCVTLDAVVHEGGTTVFPLRSDADGVVGVLEVQADAPVSSQAQALVLNMLNVFRNFESLLDDSERDTLTGLLNRKTFDETFLKISQPGTGSGRDSGDTATASAATGEAGPPTSAAPAEERRQPAAIDHWLAVVDIDHFKTVNDRFGHLIGDEVLLLLARIMRSTFRLSDRLYRFGGEEFLVLMPARSRGHVEVALERLRLQVACYRFPQAGQVTISLGLTQVRPGDTPSGAFERADRAVYWSKQHGRNRLTCHETLVERGLLPPTRRRDDVEMF